MNPVPKIIDFGIAKSLSVPLTEATIHTGLHQFLGTPAYMSPEQADLSPDIDTRTDIYSLGVLLYELLTGRPPIDNHELLTAGLEEMRRIIREKEPALPSHAAALNRNLNPLISPSSVRGDLDCIIMKCLEKDRFRRYETASALAEDIQRHLVDQPILARPANAIYQFEKFTSRNKLAVMAATSVFLALLVGVVATSWQALRARRAERERALQQARAELRLEAAVKLLNKAFENVSPALANVIGAAKAREDLADAALGVIEQVQQGDKLSPEFRRVLAQLYTELGFMHGWFAGNVTGNFDAGLKAAEQAIALLKFESETVDKPFRLARAEMAAGFAAWGMWQTQEAMSHFREMQKWAGVLTQSTNSGLQELGARFLLWSEGCIGDTLLRMGQTQEALNN